jgi:hypothetical protein
MNILHILDSIDLCDNACQNVPSDSSYSCEFLTNVMKYARSTMQQTKEKNIKRSWSERMYIFLLTKKT